MAVAALDVVAGVRNVRRRRAEARTMMRKSVTIRRPPHDVEDAWRAADDVRRKVRRAGGTASFVPAPGDRGTELVVQFLGTRRPPDAGTALKKVTGRDLATQLADDLRLLKQRMEAGEVVRSDSTPSGHLLGDQLTQRPAQPAKGRR
jgi:uncharacterized membrane protein